MPWPTTRTRPRELRSLQAALLQDLNTSSRSRPFSTPSDSRGLSLGERRGNSPRKQKLEGDDRDRLNRMLLADAYPKEVPFADGILCISDKGAANLASLGFVCFLIGRFSGAGF